VSIIITKDTEVTKEHLHHRLSKRNV